MKTKYSLTKDFILDKARDGVIIFNVANSTFYNFNKAGSYLMTRIIKNEDKNKLVERIIKKYDINRIKAEKDVSDFLKELLKNKIITFLK